MDRGVLSGKGTLASEARGFIGADSGSEKRVGIRNENKIRQERGGFTGAS